MSQDNHIPPKKSADNMTFWEHLDEMRGRLVRAIVVFFLGFMVCFFLANEWVLEFLRAPLFEVMPEDQQKLHFTSLFENFLTHLKIAGVSSIFLLSPYLFWEIWGFIAPGLYPRERKYVVPFILIATLFFVSGALFAYFILFPTAFHFFVNFGLESDVPLLTINSYYTTALKLLLLFGAAFELPVLVCLLGFLGVIDAEFLRKHRPQGIIGITVICAMFAPPDAISMLIMMAPLILMYEGSIYVVGWIGAKRRNRAAAEQSVQEKSGFRDS